MRPGAALRLARPAVRAERGRTALVAGSTALAGALLLATARIARYGLLGDTSDGVDGRGGLAQYVTEDGLRPGVVLGGLLLVVPALALGLQALRVGSLARERRTASLRLAGATTGEVRAVAAAEAATGALVGGLLAGPGYLLLWLLLGLLPPPGARMVPVPDLLDVVSWPLVVLLAVGVGATAGAVVQGRTDVDPLGVRRRAAVSAPGRANLVAMVLGLVLVAFAIAYVTRKVPVPRAVDDVLRLVTPAVFALGALLTAFAAAPRVVRRRGRRLRRHGGAVDLLAGARLAADPRSPGRVGAVLLVCGLALGIEAFFLASLFTMDGGTAGSLGFYLGGVAATTVAVLVAVAVAVLTLLVGAADALLDARRPLASAVALGVDEPTLARVLVRQQQAVAVPAIVGGVLVGGLLTLSLTLGADDHRAGRIALVVAGVAGVAALAAGVVALVVRLSARLLRSRLRAAIDPENLRTA